MTISKHVALPFNTMGDSPLVGSGSVNPNIDYRLQKLKQKKTKKKKTETHSYPFKLLYFPVLAKRRMGRVTTVPWSRAFFNDNHHVAHAVRLQTDQKLQQH